MTQLPFTSLDELSSFGDAGSRLAEAAQGLNPLHVPLVLGMFSLYIELVRIGWYRDEEIDWPPHRSTIIEEVGWPSLGFTSDVLAIMRYLPYFNTEKQSRHNGDLVPGAPPFSYISPLLTDIRGPIPQLDQDTLVPSHMLRLVHGGHAGTEYIYDTATGLITRLDMSSYRIDIPNPLIHTATHLAWTPASQLFQTWLKNLRTLHWLPDPTREDSYEEEPPSQPNDSDRWRHPVYSRKNRVHYFRAKKRIFRSHGWPTSADYDSQACFAELALFHERERELYHAVMNHEYPMDFEMYYPEVQEEPLRTYERFLEEAVGEDAVTEPQIPTDPSMIGHLEPGFDLAAARRKRDEYWASKQEL